MTTAIFLLTDDRPARAAEFGKQAETYAKECQVDLGRIHRCKRVEDLVTPVSAYADASITRMAFFGHGTPTGLMRPGRWGLDTREAKTRRPQYMAVDEFAAVWATKLDACALASLAACLCSRDPKWRRVQLWGRDLSSWSAKSYQDGGLKSLAAALCRALSDAGVRGVRVRGHCAAGHCTAQALLREHMADDEGGIGRALFRSVFPELANDGKIKLADMRRWQAVVKGRIARDYLLGLRPDEEIVREIREVWS